MRKKQFTTSFFDYCSRLQNSGYIVKVHHIDDWTYELIEVYDKRNNNFCGEFSTPRKAWSQLKRNIIMEDMVFHLKCNAPNYEQHRGYPDGNVAMETAKNDFFSLQSQFEARGFNVKTFFRSNPMRGRIQVEIDGFYYYVELFKAKDL